MPHATAYAGKELTISGHKFYIGLFRWPVPDETESYFAALMIDDGGDNWRTLLQLDPMPILEKPTKGAMATMSDILIEFNAKIAELPVIDTTSDLTWLQRLKKLFDNVTAVDGKIFSGPL